MNASVPIRKFRSPMGEVMLRIWMRRFSRDRRANVAMIFALLHATNFSLRAWPLALGQQIYAFALGVLYAYWLEKSRSIVAPIIGHNVGDFVEYAIAILWVAA